MKLIAALIAALSFMLASVNAFANDPHVESVTRTVLTAKGKVEKTEDGQSLILVDFAVPGAAPHDHRKDDPYERRNGNIIWVYFRTRPFHFAK